MASIWDIVFLCSLALSVGCTLLFTYRVLLHPLAGVPGPLAMKLTGWAHFNLVLSGRRAYVLQELHQTYGPMVRLAPNLVSINSVTALNGIYGDRKAPIIKSNWYEAPAAPEKGYSSFTERDEAIHAPRRRLLNHALSEKGLRDSETFVSANVNTWLDRLGDRKESTSPWSEPKNVYQWIRYLTFDILTDLCFGRSFDLLNKTDMRFAEGLIPCLTQMANELGFNPLRPIVSFILFRTPLGDILGGEMVRSIARFTKTSRNILEERRNQEVSGGSPGSEMRKDFFHHLFKGTDPETGNSLTNEELAAESNNLMIAGADTTSTTLAACIFYLLRHPAKLAALRKELDENFSSISDINYYGTVLGRLPYLRAFINETLRHSPPVGGGLTREVIGQGITVDEKFYPPKTEVCVPLYALLHNPEYYPDPYSFSPERWIVNEKAGYTKEMVDRAQAAFCPFLVGQRGCVGKNLAYIELSLSIARLVCKFDMEEVPGWEQSLRQESDLVKDFELVTPQGEYRGRDSFVFASNGPLVRFRDRQI